MSIAYKCRRLEGKVAVVTASTEGIGYQIALRLGLEGAKIVVSSRKQENVEKAVELLRSQNLEVFGLVCHVGKDNDRKTLLEQTVKSFGGIDILVSNAGFNPFFGKTVKATESDWDQTFDINLKAAFFLIKDAVPHMKNRGNGSIILINSISAFQPQGLMGCYGISKTAMLGLTKALVPELAECNIRINSVCPGLITTPFSAPLWKNGAAAERINRDIPLQRLGEAEEISGIVAFLASDDASYMTGENIVLAGGEFSRL